MQDAKFNAVETITAKFHSGAVGLSDAQRSLRDAMALDRINGRNRALQEFSPISEGSIGDRYRFRAECHRDAELFIFSILWFIEPTWTISPLTYYPDVVVTFSIRKEISPRDLLWVASSIVDGHVLVQTLEKEDWYTGKRVYDRVLDIYEPTNKPSEAVLRDMKKGAAHHIKSRKNSLADAKAFSENLKALSL